MLRRKLVVGVVAMVSTMGTMALTSVDLGACGDKFLRPGRSGRWQNYAAMHPAAILLYSVRDRETRSDQGLADDAQEGRSQIAGRAIGG